MNKIRGIQITSERPAVRTHGGIKAVTYIVNPQSITVDCDLGSLVITPDELVSYLEKRKNDVGNVRKPKLKTLVGAFAFHLADLLGMDEDNEGTVKKYHALIDEYEKKIEDINLT